MPVETATETYHRTVYEHLQGGGRTFTDREPQAGDLAFFHGTYDRDGTGKRDDRFTVAAVVESIEEGGVVVCVGHVRGEVRRFVMNRDRPWVRRDVWTGREVNTPIATRESTHGHDAPVLAGQLLAGFARL